ncbi:3-hydroxy-fatty acyl-ACP dehydratase [Serratia sp. M24T3]|uniref:ApeP family dehydratase n=1 Tax=Serratia sp. M24T3 TaxID=932213 RepID=UPI00025B91C0|nr:3-hydroxy-fatty acyl-ACP dehydratase [Serratia sp. M24T3]EIC83219.1 beta-hydroxyacyl-(acyl-carrier-protein) dehydratase FabA/FabZ [Serratia sp. M24T3]
MTFLAAEHYLPHEAPMVMLENVLDVGKDSACCEVKVSADSLLASFLDQHGQLPVWFAIELMAQTVGVWNGWHAQQEGGEPQLGMLLGGRGMKCSIAAFPAGSLLVIHVSQLLKDDKLACFECTIASRDSQTQVDTQLVQARLNTYQPEAEEAKRLLQGTAT